MQESYFYVVYGILYISHRAHQASMQCKTDTKMAKEVLALEANLDVGLVFGLVMALQYYICGSMPVVVYAHVAKYVMPKTAIMQDSVNTQKVQTLGNKCANNVTWKTWWNTFVNIVRTCQAHVPIADHKYEACSHTLPLYDLCIFTHPNPYMSCFLFHCS